MTFDHPPEWQDTTVAPDSVGFAQPSPRLAPVPSPHAPHHPTSQELANLVRELFAEGSLTWDQLQALSKVAELKPVLEPAVAGVPALRRVAGHRQ